MKMIDLASLQRRIEMLSTDALLVLSKVSRGWSDEKIVAWGTGWKLTPAKIRQALKEIGYRLAISQILENQASRVLAGRLYRVHCARNLSHLHTKREKKKTTTAGASFFHNRKERRIAELDPHLVSETAIKLRALDDASKRVADHVANGVVDLGFFLGVEGKVAVRLRESVYAQLGLSTGLARRQRHAVLVAAHRSLNGA